jgi:hypothetical protein
LVEEMAAAASSLKSQAHDLVGTVAVFNLGGAGQAFVPPKAAVRSSTSKASSFKGAERRGDGVPPRATPSAKHAPQTKPSTPPKLVQVVTPKKPVPAGGDDDWETF